MLHLIGNANKAVTGLLAPQAGLPALRAGQANLPAGSRLLESV